MARRCDTIVVLALIAAVFGIYGRTLAYGFVEYDDNLYITRNAEVQAGLNWGNVKWAFLTDRALYFHPLTWLSHMTDCEIFGLRAWGHHLTSVALHAANSALFYLALLRLTGARWRSAFAAAVFAVHPIGVETVAWIAERRGVLSSFFWLLTMAAYARYAARPHVARMGIVTFWFACALMAKPMVVTLPCALLLLDYWPLDRLGQIGFTRACVRRCVCLAGEKAPLFALTAGISALTAAMQKSGGAIIGGDVVPWQARLTNGVYAYGFYLAKAFCPAGLCAYYPQPLAARPWGELVPAIALLATLGAVCIVFRLNRYLTVGSLWYGGVLLPVAFVHAGGFAFADRYAYVPLLGIWMASTWAAADIANRFRIPRAAIAVAAAAVLLALGALSAIQVRTWRDSESLFRRAVAVTGRNSYAHNALGVVLAQRHRDREALEQYAMAIADNPQNLDAHDNMGRLLAGTGRKEEAIAVLQRAVTINPNHTPSQCALASLLEASGRLDEAAAHYIEAVRVDPSLAEAHRGSANTLAALGRSEEAQRHYERAVALDRDDCAARLDFAKFRVGLGDLDGAEQTYREAIAVAPQNATAHFDLAVLLEVRGRRDEAIAHYRQAAELDPADADIRARLESAVARQRANAAAPAP